jgi:hypothetical protein
MVDVLYFQVDVLYFDYKKAFDRVDNSVLLAKLESLCFTPQLLRLLQNYLSGRRQYVKYGSFVLKSYDTPSGVNQGSILGPLLFLLFVNDIAGIFRHSKCLLYADDLKIYLEVKSENECGLIQRDIDALHNWSILNRMELNLSKYCRLLGSDHRLASDMN